MMTALIAEIFPTGVVQSELANAPLREHVVHLEKNSFEKSDEEEESKQPVEG